jgi:hypothetical protein
VKRPLFTEITFDDSPETALGEITPRKSGLCESITVTSLQRTILKLRTPSVPINHNWNCHAGVTQNLPSLTKLTSLTLPGD